MRKPTIYILPEHPNAGPLFISLSKNVRKKRGALKQAQLKESTATVRAEPLAAVIQPPRLQVHVGQATSIKCIVSGRPVGGISWRFNQRVLPVSDRVSLPSSETVHIRSVQKEDRGMYQCFVQNDQDSVQAGFELALAGKWHAKVVCIKVFP